MTRLPAPGEPASSALVLETARSQWILHFCCHGAADPLDPARSGLHLADDQQITAADVMSQHIASRLVVLSACESGIVGRDLPDEVIGLPTAFLEAGAAGIVGSLWSVTEPATVAVLDEFYRRWDSGRGSSPRRCARSRAVVGSPRDQRGVARAVSRHRPIRPGSGAGRRVAIVARRDAFERARRLGGVDVRRRVTMTGSATYSLVAVGIT